MLTHIIASSHPIRIRAAGMVGGCFYHFRWIIQSSTAAARKYSPYNEGGRIKCRRALGKNRCLGYVKKKPTRTHIEMEKLDFTADDSGKGRRRKRMREIER